MGRRATSTYSAGEQIEAFQERAADVRTHPFFARPGEYSFSFYGRWQEAKTMWSFGLPPASRDQQYALASLMRPFLANDDMVSLFAVFKTFGRVCRDPIIRETLGDIRHDYQKRRDGMLFSRTTSWSTGDTPPTWITDRQIADAVLYGRLLHTSQEKRQLLNRLAGPGQAESEHQAVMSLFHVTGSTVLQVDYLLRLAIEAKALDL